MADNKRDRTRINAGFEACVVLDDTTIPVETRNLSLKGALLTGCDACFIDSECELHIPLSPGIRIIVEGDVVRCDSGQIAMRFREMDEVSFTTLHRLIQLNAFDPEAIDEELVQIFKKLD